MAFASTELAARIERAECRLLTDAVTSASSRLGGAVFAIPIAGGVATFSEPGSPLNKVAGLGFGGLPGAADWSAVEAAYRSHGVPVQVELPSLADPAVARQLTARGYQLVGFENVLGLALPAPPIEVRPGLDVRPSPADEFDLWLDIVVGGFAAPDVQGVPSHEHYDRAVLERIMRDFSQARGVVRYLARRSEIAAGGGIMRIDDALAQLGGAATSPAHRRHGVQTALIAARLAEAARQGCDLAVVTTQPGSKSQQNVQRFGFEVIYTRAVLVGEA